MGIKKGEQLYKKNHKKAGGRTKGTLNKFTTLKNAFLEAFQELQKDKKVKLDKWGKMNPRHFYRMIATMLPKEIAVTGKDGEDLFENTEEVSPEELDKKIQSVINRLKSKK